MKQLLTSVCALALIASAATANATIPVNIPVNTPIGGAGLNGVGSTALNNPAGLDHKLKTVASTDLGAATNKARSMVNKELGGGFRLASTGHIFAAGSSSPIAMVDNHGNVTSNGSAALTAETKSMLNRLVKGVNIPAGFGGSARTPSTFIQKNSYVASSDNGDVYYGGTGLYGAENALLKAIVGAAASAATSAVASATNGNNSSTPGTTQATPGTTTATSTAASTGPVHALPGSNQVVDANGVVVATYNPTNGSFTTSNGTAIQANSAEYASYKAALTSASQMTTAAN